MVRPAMSIAVAAGGDRVGQDPAGCFQIPALADLLGAEQGAPHGHGRVVGVKGIVGPHRQREQRGRHEQEKPQPAPH